MPKEMKRPTSHISGNSIKPALSKAVEFYTDNNRQAYECIHERDEYIDYLESKLSNARPQQALQVVPECVGVAIESLPDHCSAFEAISLIEEKIKTLPVENEDWLPVYNWLCEGVENQDIFALAFITGKYEVEKPQLFYIELPKVFGLSDSAFVSKAESGIISEFTKGKNYALKFTEQEIKSIDERYWQFAVPVEDNK